MVISRSTALVALSLVCSFEFAWSTDKPLKTYLPSHAMNELFAGRLLVKVKGADIKPGAPAQPTNLQISRIAGVLKGGRMVGGLNHGGWTLWEYSEKVNPTLAAQSLMHDSDVICAEPENKMYPVTLPVPNDPDWSAFELSSDYVLHTASSGSGGSGGSTGIYGGSSGVYGGSTGSGYQGGSGGSSGSGGSGGSSGSNGSGHLVPSKTKAKTGAAGFRRLWNLWDINAVTSDSGGIVSGGWAVFPGQWYTAGTKPADCPTIAFVDSGADIDHPDFVNAGGTGSDVQQGGQIAKGLSAAFLNGAVASGSDLSDGNGHGTAVVGAAIAAGNNGSYNGHGTIGVGYNSKGMILKVFDATGSATDDNVAAAITYAADHGADIINVSLSTENYSQILQDAVTYAFQKGCLIIAAGSERITGGGKLGPCYPAACSGALGVSANGPGRKSAERSYSGAGAYVDIAAPGGDLVPYASGYRRIQYVFSTSSRFQSTLGEGNYNPPYTRGYSYFLNGTSMAAPQVSGAAGLLYGQNHLSAGVPGSNLRAFQSLELSADATGHAAHGGWEPSQGFGSLDVLQLLSLKSNPNPRTAAVGDVTGMVYRGGRPLGGVLVIARSTAVPVKTYRTTTLRDGSYRFSPFPGGTYDVIADIPGFVKSKRVLVKNGCDLPAIDFFGGGAPDTTSPVVSMFNIVSASKSSVSIRQWAFDPESEIESATVQIGSSPGQSNIMPPTQVALGSVDLNLSGLNLPASYVLSESFANGFGGLTKAVRAVEGDLGDVVVSDAHPTTGLLQPHLTVTSGPNGSNAIAYIKIDLGPLRSNCEDVRLTLTGSAVGNPVMVGAHATSNSAWGEGSVNWKNGPAVGKMIDSQMVSYANQYTWNLTTLAKQSKAVGLKSITIALCCESASQSGASFGSLRLPARAPSIASMSHD